MRDGFLENNSNSCGETTPRKWTAHIIGAMLAAVIGGMIWFMALALDREPPFVRLYGTLVPDRVNPGDFVAVRYVTTRRRFPSDQCPGTLQQEIIDSENNIISKAVRETGPQKWERHPTDPNLEIFYGHPVQIPNSMVPGPAVFRTATFRFCNWLQYRMRWPISQVGPDLLFMILDPSKQQQKK